MPHVFIDGAAGTTGLEIEARLSGRTDFTFIRLDEADRKNDRRRIEALNAADVAILCLPDAAARDAVAMVTNPATRVIDTSSAHRTAPGWTYGFPELIGRAQIRAARRVSNPGCYPTGFLALIAPLIRSGLLSRQARLTCNAVSGYSGGGKAMIREFEEGRDAPAWRAYGFSLAHKHLPEMSHYADLAHTVLFQPSVARLYQGMVVEVPLSQPGLPSGERVSAMWRDAFRDGSLISVRDASPDDPPLRIDAMAGCDRIELAAYGQAEQLRLVACLDNLGKGASGAAVQNLNLMLGLEETSGLRLCTT